MKDPVQPPFFEMNTQQILNLVSQCESSLGNKSFIWAFLLNTHYEYRACNTTTTHIFRTLVLTIQIIKRPVHVLSFKFY
jgi:hypothetical protein